jgi:hypothetical protein
MPESSSADLLLLVEVSGCMTTCAHCWALGGDYGAMSLEDSSFVLAEVSRFCAGRGLAYHAYPMHEVTAHPRAPEMIRLFTPHLGGRYDPILTPGAPLASRPDWEEVLAAAIDCGAVVLWVAFHGFGDAHDRQLGRAGAFDETCLAVRRARQHGLGAGANVFLTKPALRDLDRLLPVLLDLGMKRVSVGPAGFTPSSHGRRYERLRPELDDLAPFAERLLPLAISPELWSDLDSHSEGAWVARAQVGGMPASDSSEPVRRLVCRPNLDLFTGTAGLYGQRHGNLRRDGADAVLARALAGPLLSEEELYFGDAAIANDELALRWGDPAGRRIYDARSLRWRWLDQQARARAARDAHRAAAPGVT